MLENLNQVDWKFLGAEDVPDMLTGLTLNDEHRRHQAYIALQDKLTQPDVFEGYGTLRDVLKNDLQTIVVHFLKALLIDVNVKDKEKILELINGLYGLSAFSEETEPYDQLDALKQAVSNEIDIYVSFLNAPEEAVRRSAMVLSERIPEHSELFIKQLLKQIKVESSSSLRMLAIWKILCKLDEDPVLKQKYQPSFIALLNECIENDDEKVKVVAAVSFISLLESNTPPDVIDIVISALISVNDSETLLGFEWRYDFYRLTYTLTQMKSKGKVALLEVLHDKNTPVINLFYALNGLLHLEFGKGELTAWQIYEYTYPDPPFVGAYLPNDFSNPTGITKLTEQQTELINQITGNPRIFEFQTNIFGIYGLPNTYEELRRHVR